MLTTHCGQPSYILQDDHVEVMVSVQGGHLTATFQTGKGEICPFFVAPWWQEARLEIDEILQVLRGDFFCFPFGGNEEPYQGIKHPVHGKTANACWHFGSLSEMNGEKTLTLTMDLDPLPGSVEKQIRIAADAPVVYQNHIIRDFQGKVSLGHHPCLQFPDRPGSAIIDMSPPVIGFTTPVPVEEPQNKGYSLLRTNAAITDSTQVECIDGTTIDLTRYPLSRKGFEDIAIFINDTSKDFTFTSAAYPEEGYLYFQLKNPKVLQETLFWMSNGGRHYAPWNGRVAGVLGMEEVTAFYHYGIKPSVDANVFQEKGYGTFLDIEKDAPISIRLIMGAVPIDREFQGVQEIIKKDDTAITILGKGGETLDVPCRVDFLAA